MEERGRERLESERTAARERHGPYHEAARVADEALCAFLTEQNDLERLAAVEDEWLRDCLRAEGDDRARKLAALGTPLASWRELEARTRGRESWAALAAGHADATLEAMIVLAYTQLTRAELISARELGEHVLTATRGRGGELELHAVNVTLQAHLGYSQDKAKRCNRAAEQP